MSRGPLASSWRPMPSVWGRHEQHVISFAGSAVAVAWEEARGRRIAEFLFERVPTCADAAPCETFHIRWLPHAQKLALYRGDVLIHLGDSEGYLAELLMGEVCRRIVANSSGGMLFHAAGLARQGLGILLPGAMETGKSTLAAWLTTQGLDYMTDELVFIPQGADEMQPFIRPLNLRRSSRVALPEGYWATLEPQLWASVESDLLPPDVLNPTGRWAAPRLHVIVFPRYVPASAPSVRRLSSAETTLALLQRMVNAGSLPGHGVPEAARIARQTPAYEARYAHLDQLVASLDVWMGESEANLS